MDDEPLRQRTEITRQRYNRLAKVYDRLEAGVERRMFAQWRKHLWSLVQGEHILEVGVGTGKNIPHYPVAAQVAGIDLSEGMLDHARKLAATTRKQITLRRMDVQNLEYPDGYFDAVISTFVFCSVPDPILGLREAGCVVRPAGSLWLLEHMRVDGPVVGMLMDIFNPLFVRLMGANINRRTIENIHRAGLKVISVDRLMGDMVRLIQARPA